MKRTVLFPKKYEPVIEWMDELYGKEEFALMLSKVLISHKTLKDRGIDTLILSELLSKYDMDIYKLIQILENHYDGTPVKTEISVTEQKTEKPVEKKAKSGILGLGIDLSS